jgi:hypothetical protein
MLLIDEANAEVGKVRHLEIPLVVRFNSAMTVDVVEPRHISA